MSRKRGPSAAKPKRPRNAEVTREAILRSAVDAFSRHGYEGVGVREIARTAGVTAVLVNRYFGSKEELFAAAVQVTFADPGGFEEERSTLARQLAARAVTNTETDTKPGDPLLLLLRSAPNPRAAEILREHITRHYERPLQALLHGPRTAQRAAMIGAILAGLRLWLKVIGSKALVDANATSLSHDIERVLQLLIDGRARRPPIRKR